MIEAQLNRYLYYCLRGEMFMFIHNITCVTRLIIRKLRLKALHPFVQIPEK